MARLACGCYLRTAGIVTHHIGRTIAVVRLGRVTCVSCSRYLSTSGVAANNIGSTVVVVCLWSMISHFCNCYLLTSGIATHNVSGAIVIICIGGMACISRGCYLSTSGIAAHNVCCTVVIVCTGSVVIVSRGCYLSTSGIDTHNVCCTVVIVLARSMVSFARQCYLIAMLTFSVQRTVNNIAYWLMISSCCFNYVVTYSTLVFGGTIIVNTAISVRLYTTRIVCSANTSICVSVCALISVYYAIRMHGRCVFKLLVAYGVHMFVKILITTLTMIMSRNCRFQSIRGMNLSRSRNQAVRFPSVSCGDNHARLVQYLGRSKRILVVCFAYFTDIVSYVTGSFTVGRDIFFLR